MGIKPDPHRFDDLFLEFGPITLRRFFGGEGLYAGDVMFGMVHGDRVFFKTDDETNKAYYKERCEPFSFTKRGTETIITGWFEIPDRLYDDPEQLAHWAREALRVAAASPTNVEKRRKAEAMAKLPGKQRKQMRKSRHKRLVPRFKA